MSRRGILQPQKPGQEEASGIRYTWGMLGLSAHLNPVLWLHKLASNRTPSLASIHRYQHVSLPRCSISDRRCFRYTTRSEGCLSSTDCVSGIGQQTAVSFIVEGCRKIAIADRKTAGLEETRLLLQKAAETSLAAAPNGVHIVSSKVDVSQEDQIERFIDQVVEELGRIDYAVNVAGAYSSFPSQFASARVLKPGRYIEQQREIPRDVLGRFRSHHRRQLPRLLAVISG